MNSLKVPESGLVLESSDTKESSLPPQAFAINLSDNVIESMIRCFQNGDDINLALGSSPSFSYGSKTHKIAPPSDYLPYELYLTRPFESTRKAEKLPCVGSLFHSPQQWKPPAKSMGGTASGGADSKLSKQSSSSKTSASSEVDSDIEALQKGLAAHEAAREKTHMVGKLPTSKKGSAKARNPLLAGYGNSPRSLPSSPALKAAGSPSSTPVISASQQAMERTKWLRVPLVHELAVEDRDVAYLSERWEGKEEEFKPILEKVADHNAGSKKWTMKRGYWKELDVWNYGYDDQEERQKAIDNAIKQYDKQRLSSLEPEWQKLLPKDERGMGKCLSRLQANIAKGPPQQAPKIKVSSADGSSTPRDDTEGTGKEKSRLGGVGGESMLRSASNPLPPKPRKLGLKDAPPSKPSIATKPKAQKPSPTKGKVVGPKANGPRVLSKEIIDNSDSSGDEMAGNKSNLPSRAARKDGDTVVVKSRPRVQEPGKVRPERVAQPVRSARENDDSSSSSSSGLPLARRLPAKATKVSQPAKKPSVEKIRNNQPLYNNSNITKHTSPTKSSPLASSPTNASEFGSETPQPPKKRKAEDDGRTMKAKRISAAVSIDVLDKAQRFKQFYEKYEALHYEIAALDQPPHSKMRDLLDMRGRLEGMKRDIYTQYNSDRESS